MLESLLGRSGFLRAWKLKAKSFDMEESVVLKGVDENGGAVSEEHCKRLLSLPVQTWERVATPSFPDLDRLRDELVTSRLKDVDARNMQYLDEEQLKLDHWAEDLKLGLEQQIRDADKQIKEARRSSSLASSLEGKLAAQKEIKTLESARNKKRRELFEMQDQIEAQREELIERIQSQMRQTHELQPLSAFEWTLVN